LYHLSIVI